MGNTHSTPHGGKGPAPNQKPAVKPPEDWNEYTEAQKFVVVSPQSDISNPSQIRHAHHKSKTTTMTNKTPMRSRTSKVVSKTVPPALMHHMNTDLPAPASFFFDPSSSSSTNDPSSNVLVDSQDVDPKGEKRGMHKTLKAKATRARHILKGCWKDQKQALEGCVLRDNQDEQFEHQRLQSMSPSQLNRQSLVVHKQSSRLPSVGNQVGVQFAPPNDDGALDHGTLSPRQVYLHDEESYMKRMQDPSHTPMVDKQTAIQSSLCPPSGSLVHHSPVAKLFEGQTISHASVVATKDSQKVSGPLVQEPSSVEKEIQRQVDEQIRLQFESKSEEIGRVKRIREGYLHKLAATKRLSEEEDFRRKSVESKIGQMREKVIAEEFKEQAVAEISEDSRIPFDEPVEANKRTLLTAADNKPAAPALASSTETAVVVQKSARGRSSAPITRSTNIVSQPKRKSAPAFRSGKPPATTATTTTSTLPVLLKIAGWEESISRKQSQPKKSVEPELPAILKLAGWKQHTQSKAVKTGVTKQTCKAEKENRVDASSETQMVVRPTPADSQDESKEHDDDVKHFPLPQSLQPKEYTRVPKDTPVVKKMSRMLMATQSIAESCDPQDRANPYGSSAYSTNLDDSVDSSATPMSDAPARPMVTRDALVNAAFLFSPSYVDHDPSLLRLCERKSEPNTSITTLDSRHRLLPSYHSRGSTVSATSTLATNRTSSVSMASRKPTIGVDSKSAPSILQATLTDKPNDVAHDRHVRFSIDPEIFPTTSDKLASTYKVTGMVNKSPLRSDKLIVPVIEQKLSDLTDAFGSGRDSLLSGADRSTADNTETQSNKDAIVSHNDSSPPSNWYSTDMDNGVTPLRSGRGTSQSHKTNSPHKRFNEAKARFSSNKISPVKKKSPVKVRPSRTRQTSGIVHARVAAMENRSTESNATVMPKTRRDTTAYKAIAPRRALLKSPVFNKYPMHQQNDSTVPLPENTTVTTQSKRTSVEGQTSKGSATYTKPSLGTMRKYRDTGMEFARERITSVPTVMVRSSTASNSDQLSNEEASDSDSDAFGDIRKASSNMEDEESYTANKLVKQLVKAHEQANNYGNTSVSTEIQEDDFAAILQYQTCADEEDSVGHDTVSTLQRNRLSLGSSTVMSGSTAPTVIRRSSIMTAGTAPTFVRRSSLLMSGTNMSHSQSKQNGNEENTLAADLNRPSWSSYPPRNTLPFREKALVRPTEQNHRTIPGQPVLSPLQRTPMQALKWRTLAAQANDKNGRSMGNQAPRLPLRRSDPNVAGG